MPKKKPSQVVDLQGLQVTGLGLAQDQRQKAMLYQLSYPVGPDI